MLLIVVVYLILLWDCKITFSNKNHDCKIEYNGLAWVCLDYLSIRKYNSSDKPIKILDKHYCN